MKGAALVSKTEKHLVRTVKYAVHSRYGRWYTLLFIALAMVGISWYPFMTAMGVYTSTGCALRMCGDTYYQQVAINHAVAQMEAIRMASLVIGVIAVVAHKLGLADEAIWNNRLRRLFHIHDILQAFRVYSRVNKILLTTWLMAAVSFGFSIIIPIVIYATR